MMKAGATGEVQLKVMAMRPARATEEEAISEMEPEEMAMAEANAEEEKETAEE